MDLRKILILIVTLCLSVLPAAAQETQTAEETPAAAAPAAPVPEYPVDTQTTALLGFYWQPSENAENYEVVWKNDQGTEGSLELKNSSQTCQTGRCIAYEEVPGAGAYTWTVTASNESGSAVSEEKSFTVTAGIRTPDAYRPNTALNSLKPLTFEWQDVGSAPTEYRLQVQERDSGKICMDRSFQKSAVYTVNGVCYIETGIYLPEGEYSWRVQSLNETEKSGWSAWQGFQLTCTDCMLENYLNTVTAALSPNGKVLDPDVRFEWLTVTGASEYRLNVKDAEGSDVLDDVIPAAGCASFTCTYDPELSLSAGETYTWSVSTYGYGGSRWGSAESVLELTEALTAPAVTFISPADYSRLDPQEPQIIWTDPGSSAAAFRLVISDAQGEALLYTDLSREDAWCDGQTCSIVFMEIPEGEGYRIFLTPYSETNAPGNTAVLTFNISFES